MLPGQTEVQLTTRHDDVAVVTVTFIAANDVALMLDKAPTR